MTLKSQVDITYLTRRNHCVFVESLQHVNTQINLLQVLTRHLKNHNINKNDLRINLIMMKKIFVAMVIIEAESRFNDIKPDETQVFALMNDRIKEGNIEEKLFRKQVTMNILKRDVTVKQLT